MKTLSIFVVSLLLLVTTACKKKNSRAELQNDCFPSGEYVRQEKNMTVTIMMATGDVCQVAPEIPTGYWYYACGIPEALREKGKKLKITGVVKTRPDQENVYNFVVTEAVAL